MAVVYKVVTPAEWEAAVTAGVFEGSPVDLRDGFIHMSSGRQVEETVARHFAGLGELMLLAVPAEALGETLRWEPSRGGDLFPHLFDRLPTDRIAWAKPFDSQDVSALRRLLLD